jgi:hypothetical protein
MLACGAVYIIAVSLQSFNLGIIHASFVSAYLLFYYP